MTLQEQFEKETGLPAKFRMKRYGGDSHGPEIYNDEYIDWLQAKAGQHETIVNDLSDTEILDWMDKETKNRCIGTQPSYGRAYANDPIRKKDPPFITLHLMGKGFLYNEDGESSHESFRDAIKLAIKRGH